MIKERGDNLMSPLCKIIYSTIHQVLTDFKIESGKPNTIKNLIHASCVMIQVESTVDLFFR